jgi:hypothetical protein
MKQTKGCNMNKLLLALCLGLCLSNLSFAEDEDQCDILEGTWVQDSIVQDYQKNPCSLIVQSSVYTDSKQVENILKMDRFNFDCNGKITVLSGFIGHEGSGDNLKRNQFSFSDNKLTHQSFFGKYTYINSQVLEHMIDDAKKCIYN